MVGRISSQPALIAAATLLTVVGFFLITSGEDDRAGSQVTAGGPSQAEEQAAGSTEAAEPDSDDDGDVSTDGEPGETTAGTPSTDEPADGPGPADAEADRDVVPSPRQTPTLPPGMHAPSPVVVPDPADVDGNDPSAVSIAALTAAYSFDSAVDTAAEDALRRAEVWLADVYQSPDYDLEGLQQDVQRDWPEWTEHRAFASISSIEPHTTDVDPADTATRAQRRFYVRVTPVGRDAWNGNLMVHQWFVFLGRDAVSEDWKVVELQTPLAHR